MKNSDVDQREMEAAVAYMRNALSVIRANEDRLPHVIYMPDGSILNLLDGRAEQILNGIESLYITKERS